MSYRCFEVEVSGAVAQLRLNRPEALNTMTPAFWSELPAAVHQLSARGDVRALVLASSGPHFSAGMDLSVFSPEHLVGRDAAGGLAGASPGGGSAGGGSFAGGDGPVEPGRLRAQMWQRIKLLQASFSALEQARMPVLAAVQGGCVGGAVDLISACDLRYASADAFFCVQEINIGMAADVGTLQRLPKIIPDGVAREMAYTGRRLGAQRAYEVGLVQQVYPDHASLLAGVLATAREIAAKSPLAIWGSKVAMTYARDHPVPDALEQMAGWQSGMFQPADLMEAFAAKAAGRPAVYPDLLADPHGV